MGWTQYANRVHNPKAELERLCTWENDHQTVRVLKSALVNFTEFYAAVETTDKTTNKREVWAAAFMVMLNPFGYKDMDETMGPNIRNCPQAILELLTPTDHQYATEWRADCWNAIAARRAAPKVGSLIKFTNPIRFTDGSEHQTFKLVAHGRSGRGQAFRPINGYGLYKITGWKHLAYKEITA